MSDKNTVFSMRVGIQEKSVFYPISILKRMSRRKIKNNYCFLQRIKLWFVYFLFFFNYKHSRQYGTELYLTDVINDLVNELKKYNFKNLKFIYLTTLSDRKHSQFHPHDLFGIFVDFFLTDYFLQIFEKKQTL